MSGGLEARWVQLLDSGRWRRLLSSTTGSRVQSSQAFRSVDLARRSAVTRYEAWRDRDRFSEVETLVVFIGHVKSGGSLIGAMVDAHPDALVSDEVDLLRYLQAGFRREQLFQLVARGSRREAMKGRVTARRLDPYSLAVAGAFQGVSTRPRVLGDVRSGPTTRRLGERLELLTQLDDAMAPTEPRYVHVVRNPFDPISAMVRRGQRTFENAIQDYTDQCERLLRIREVLPRERLLTVRYEAFTRRPDRAARRGVRVPWPGRHHGVPRRVCRGHPARPARGAHGTRLEPGVDLVGAAPHRLGAVPERLHVGVIVEMLGAPGVGKTTMIDAVEAGCRDAGRTPFTIEHAARCFAARRSSDGSRPACCRTGSIGEPSGRSFDSSAGGTPSGSRSCTGGSPATCSSRNVVVRRRRTRRDGGSSTGTCG